MKCEKYINPIIPTSGFNISRNIAARVLLQKESILKDNKLT